jgi:hypothetical protein
MSRVTCGDLKSVWPPSARVRSLSPLFRVARHLTGAAIEDHTSNEERRERKSFNERLTAAEAKAQPILAEGNEAERGAKKTTETELILCRWTTK